jgi:hypothetical protein
MLSGIEFDYATFACGECRDNIDNRPVAGILPSLDFVEARDHV